MMKRNISNKKPAKLPGKSLVASAFGAAAEEFGKEIAPVGAVAGQVTAQATILLLRNTSRLVWGIEKLEEWIVQKVSPMVEEIPLENRKEADPRIAAPALEYVRYVEDDAVLQDTFASIIANSMDNRTNTHPSYVEKLKSMNGDECRILLHLDYGRNRPLMSFMMKMDAGETEFISDFSTEFEKIDLLETNKTQIYLRNLQSLGIIHIDYERWLANDVEYSDIRKNIVYTYNKKAIGDKFRERLGMFGLTAYGSSFRRAIAK